MRLKPQRHAAFAITDQLMKAGDWATIEARMQKLLDAVKAAIA